MERELNKQITRLARIRLAIEAHLRDPLLAVLDAVAGATPSAAQSARNEISKMSR